MIIEWGRRVGPRTESPQTESLRTRMSGEVSCGTWEFRPSESRTRFSQALRNPDS